VRLYISRGDGALVVHQAGAPWLSMTRSTNFGAPENRLKKKGLWRRRKLAIELPDRWGIWLGDEIFYFGGQKKTTVKSEQAGWDVEEGSQKLVSDEKPSYRDVTTTSSVPLILVQNYNASRKICTILPAFQQLDLTRNLTKLTKRKLFWIVQTIICCTHVFNYVSK
jgi:hypothetical protein